MSALCSQFPKCGTAAWSIPWGNSRSAIEQMHQNYPHTPSAKQLGNFTYKPPLIVGWVLFPGFVAPPTHAEWPPVVLGKAPGPELQILQMGLSTLPPTPVAVSNPASVCLTPFPELLQLSWASLKGPRNGRELRHLQSFWLRKRKFVKEEPVSSNQIFVNLWQGSQAYKFPPSDIKMYLYREVGGISLHMNMQISGFVSIWGWEWEWDSEYRAMNS